MAKGHYLQLEAAPEGVTESFPFGLVVENARGGWSQEGPPFLKGISINR